MKISENLSHFKDDIFLLVVAGSERALFYIVKDGYINVVAEVEELPVQYSDNEGFFERSGFGKVFGGGTVLEENKIEREKRFLKKVQAEIDKMEQKYSFNKIYLFAPNYMEKRIFSDMTKEQKSYVIARYRHNYINKHPVYLLEKIQKEYDNFFGQKVPLKKEARKILKKFDLTHH